MTAPRELMSLEAERAVLGPLLLQNAAIDEIRFLQAEHFSDQVHGRLFKAIATLIDRGEIASPVTVHRFFVEDDGLSGVDVGQFLAELADAATTIISLPDYARTILDLAVRRELARLGNELAGRALEPQLDEPPSSIISDTAHALDRLSEGETGGTPTEERLSDAAERVIDRFSNSSAGPIGVPTGIKELDHLLGGLRKGEVTVLAGRTGMGKSAVAQHIAAMVARETGSVLMFSLEMESEQIAGREMAARSCLPYERIDRAEISRNDIMRLANIAADMGGLPFWLSTRHDLTISELRSQARRQHRKEPLSLVVVDYVQLVRAEARYRGNRVLEVSEVTRGLKMLARDLNVPVLVLSQLNREVEGRNDKRPVLSDLRESGSIEQDAAVVIFIYRPDVYLERAGPAKGQSDEEFVAGLEEQKKFIELIIAKNRHGRTAQIRTAADLPTNRFGDRVSEASK
jgi:replicative DNA helicase